MNKDWYTNDQEFIRSIYGDDAGLFTGLLAATSPQMGIRKNWNTATRLYRTWKAGRIDLSGLMPCHIPNVNRVLNGEPLQGDKVKRFYANLMGNDNCVTIDTWMLRLFKWRRKRHPSKCQYAKLEKAFISVANNIGLSPAGLQALLWCGYRSRQGKSNVSYSIVGADVDQMKFVYDDIPI